MWRTLVENIQRFDLTPIEEAVAYQNRSDAGHTQTEIARRIGKTQSYVAQKLRLLRLLAEGGSRCCSQLMRRPPAHRGARLADWQAGHLGYDGSIRQIVQALETWPERALAG